MEERKIVGVEDMSFTGTDGTPVKGKVIHTTERMDPKKGQGEKADHFFMSAAKLSTLDFTPAVGMTVEVFYNRYGKVATLRLLSNDNSFVDLIE